MFIEIDGFKLNYEVYGQGKKLLLLHGWGVDLHTFSQVVPNLAQRFQVILLDLPGFGLSSKLTKPLGTLDYAYTVEKFLEKLDVRQTAVLGHSFGGTVSLYLASFSNRLTKLILEDSAGLYPKTAWIQFKIFLYKILKFTISPAYRETLRSILGSADYKTSGPLSSTLIKVVNSNVSHLLGRITVPTLIVWGEKDEVTTIREARLLNTGIKNSSVLIIKNCGHFPHLENPSEFTAAVAEFINEKEINV